MQMKPLISSKVAKELLQEKKFKVVQRDVVDQFITNNTISTENVQSAMDESGNVFLHKIVKSSFKAKGITPKILPTTIVVWKL